MIKIEGIDAAIDWLKEEVVNETNMMAKNIMEDAIQNTPVGRTGHLKASWVLTPATPTNEQAVVENTAPYAAHVEYGTEDTPAVLMLTNAVDREMNK